MTTPGQPSTVHFGATDGAVSGEVLARSSRPQLVQRLNGAMRGGVTSSIVPLQCGHFVEPVVVLILEFSSLRRIVRPG